MIDKFQKIELKISLLHLKRFMFLISILFFHLIKNLHKLKLKLVFLKSLN
jgi:hypothetical protein